MSDNKGSKQSNEDLKYPTPAHVRTPLRPTVPVEYPEKSKKEGSEKGNSLDWLKEADSYEAPEEKRDEEKDEGKKQGSSEKSGLPDWLIEADNHEPKE
ncbi:hypothetical protein ANO14919_026580 [Xylariales sp. No.14919]|nr:hypothetical protein ANO14919_026580 [Xylariales sp. No.14919]